MRRLRVIVTIEAYDFSEVLDAKEVASEIQSNLESVYNAQVTVTELSDYRESVIGSHEV